jgi:hypothetical protein
VKRLLILAPAILLFAGCSYHNTTGVVERVGTGTTGGAALIERREHRYIKLVNDPMVYDCEIETVSACAVLTPGQKITLVVQDGENADVRGLSFN